MSFGRGLFTFCTICIYLHTCTGNENHYVKTIQRSIQFHRHIKRISSEKIVPDVYLDVMGIKNLNMADLLASTEDDGLEVSSSDLNHTVSEKCQEHWTLIKTAATNGERWALELIDAAGKPSSGILEGDLYWLGSYDECKNVQPVELKNNATEEVKPFDGQYCYLAAPFPLNDTGYGVSPYVLNALCAPSTCSHMDLTILVYELAGRVSPKINLQKLGAVVNCKAQISDLDTKAVVAIIILSFLGAFILLGTSYDVFFIQLPQYKQTLMKSKSDIQKWSVDVPGEKLPLIERKTEEVKTVDHGIVGELLLAFSLYTNGKKLLSTKQGAGALTSINGIRFLSMSWVVLGHTYTFVTSYGSNIGSYSATVFHRWSFQAICNAGVSVDTFFTLSGLLLAYLTLKELDRKQGKINWFMFYFHRFWRLTPAYMLVLMVDVCLVRYFGDGPLFPEQGFEKDFCKTTWWKNLLYINNFFGINDMCMAWSWYLANDMQFFIISPLMLLPLFTSAFVGVAACCGLLVASFITTGTISSHYELPATPLFGDQSKVGHFTDSYYTKPYCRIGPYIIGILTGYILYKTNCKAKLNQYVNICCWLLATFFAVIILYGLYDPDNTHPLSTSVAALYNTTYRAVWGACVCWVIFSCVTGNGGFINTLLSWSPFVPLGRLTYCTYLVHILVIDLYVMSQRTMPYFTDFYMIYFFLASLVVANMVAFVTSLTFEAPMMGLEKLIFRREKTKS